MTSIRVDGDAIVAGNARGELVKLDEPLSFWGGFDPVTGVIIDQAHPQVGVSLAGKIVAMPGSRGSSGTPGVVGEAIRLGTGPIGMIITKADMNLVAGVLVAERLYGTQCPIFVIGQTQFEQLTNGHEIELASSD